MREKRITEAFSRGRIAYPQFEADAENESRTADTLNGFYRALRDGAAAYIDELAHDAGGISRTYTADYTLRQDGDILVVKYLLLIRRRGHTEARKTLLHRWQNGYLIPPGKKKGQKRKIRLKQKGKKDII